MKLKSKKEKLLKLSPEKTKQKLTAKIKMIINNRQCLHQLFSEQYPVFKSEKKGIGK